MATHRFDAADIDSKTRALLDFAYTLSQHPAEITRRDRDALLEAGWTEQQVIEAVHITGIFEYFNRVAEGLGMASRGVDGPLLLEDLHTPPGER